MIERVAELADATSLLSLSH